MTRRELRERERAAAEFAEAEAAEVAEYGEAASEPQPRHHGHGAPPTPSVVEASVAPISHGSLGTASSTPPSPAPSASEPAGPSSAPAPVAGDGEADDYFHRLATANYADAPTGMIVLPDIVTPDVTGALTRSGDVMVTGSMRVSRDLSEYGVYREGLDQADDDLDDSGVVPSGELGPVRARDVISAGATELTIAPTRQKGIGITIWVVVGALVAAAIGVGVLVFGYLSGWF